MNALVARCIALAKAARKKEHVPLKVEAIIGRAKIVRRNRYTPYVKVYPLVELECVVDFLDNGSKPIKKGQSVFARQICDDGRHHDRIRLSGENRWRRVEYFKLAE